MHVVRAENYVYYLKGGGKLIDGISGNFSVSLGHNNRILAQAYQDPHYQSAQRLRNEIQPLCPHIGQWHFTTSREAAVELALMCAIEYGVSRRRPLSKRVAVISGQDHGNSFGLGHFHHPFDLYRRPFDVLEVLAEELFKKPEPWDALPIDFDAFLLEPVQVLTGLDVSDSVTLGKLKRWCILLDACLIADETFTSLGRCGVTGFMMGLGKVADIVIVGPALGQGLPLFGIGLSSELFPLDFEPVVGWPSEDRRLCAVGEAVLRAMKYTEPYKDSLTQNACSLGVAWKDAFADSDTQIRVRGGMIHLNAGKNAIEVHQRLLTEKKIVADVHPPWLVFMPCFFMPAEINSRIIVATKEVLQHA